MAQVMKMYADNTCIRWTPRTNEKNYVKILNSGGWSLYLNTSIAYKNNNTKTFYWLAVSRVTWDTRIMGLEYRPSLWKEGPGRQVCFTSLCTSLDSHTSKTESTEIKPSSSNMITLKRVIS